MRKLQIYTIGHSTYEIDFFIELLKKYNINCVVDVRSVPASSYNAQYNQEPLKNILKKNHIEYLHFSKEFGARQNNSELLDNCGILDFEKVRNSNNFNKGVTRLKNGIKNGFIIAIMCSESNPLDCHRFSMISIGLKEKGFDIFHILKDKSIKTQSQLENDLLIESGMKYVQKNLFEQNLSNDEFNKKNLKKALREKNIKIGYKPIFND